MLLLIKNRATKKKLEALAEHFKGYIKIVVDMEKEMLAGGADRHSDEEKALLEQGSKQKDLWGGGYDLETKEIDYNSVINLRPNADNLSRDILSRELRKKFERIVKKLLM